MLDSQQREQRERDRAASRYRLCILLCQQLELCDLKRPCFTIRKCLPQVLCMEGEGGHALGGRGGAARRHSGVEAVCDTLGRASSAPHVRDGVESLTESGALVSELARTHRTLDDSAREQELQALNVQVAVLEAKIEMLARKSCTCCCLS